MTQYFEGFRPETLVAIEAVERALELARRGVGRADISAQGNRDLVTATDVTVEDAIRAVLSDTVGCLVVGEERGGDAPADGSPYWLVDPICGTRNFASGTPLYCVNLALVEGDQIIVAAVGDPSTVEIHVAERGGGAWALRPGLDAHSPSATRTEPSSSKMASQPALAASVPRSSRLERFGQIAGTSDHWEPRWRWPTWPPVESRPTCCSGPRRSTLAAGSLLATEAGGSLSDIDGAPWTIHSDSILASASPDLQQQLLNLARIAKGTGLPAEDL